MNIIFRTTKQIYDKFYLLKEHPENEEAKSFMVGVLKEYQLIQDKKSTQSRIVREVINDFMDNNWSELAPLL